MDKASKDVSISDHTSSGTETDLDFEDSGSEYKPESDENGETKRKRKKVYNKRQTKKDGSIAVSEKKVNPKNAPRKICPICDKSIKTLSKHIKIHNERSRLQCDLCSSVYASKDSLKRHFLKYHPNAENGIDATLAKHNCDECSSIFMTQIMLSTHKRECHPNINYVRVSCNKCRKTYANLKNLRKHFCNVGIVIQCDICIQSFTTYKDLTHHLQTHVPPPTFTNTNGTTAPNAASTDMVSDGSESSHDALNGQVIKAVRKSGTSAQLLYEVKSAPSPLLEDTQMATTDPDVQKAFQSNSDIELLDQPKIERSTVESNSPAGDDVVEKFKSKIAKSKSERSLVQQQSSTPIDSDLEKALPANSENDAEQPTTKSDKKKRKMDTCKSAPSPLLEDTQMATTDPDVQKALQSNSDIELLDQPKIERSTVESNSLAADDIVEKDNRKIAKSQSERSLVQQQSSTPIDCDMENALPSNSENVAEQPTTKSDKKKRKMHTSKNAPSPLLENNTQMATDPYVHKAFQSNSESELLHQPKIQRTTVKSNSLAVQDILEKFKGKFAKSESKPSLRQQNSTTPIDCGVEQMSSSNYETVAKAKSLLHSDDLPINGTRKIDIYNNEPSAVVRKKANRIDSDLENGLPSNLESLLQAHNTIIDERNERNEISDETFQQQSCKVYDTDLTNSFDKLNVHLQCYPDGTSNSDTVQQEKKPIDGSEICVELR